MRSDNVNSEKINFQEVKWFRLTSGNGGVVYYKNRLCKEESFLQLHILRKDKSIYKIEGKIQHACNKILPISYKIYI